MKYQTGEVVIVRGKGDARIDDWNCSENTYRVHYGGESYEWVQEKDLKRPG